MAEKKISFGFKQVQKQSILLPTRIDNDKDKKNDVELIQCLEGQTIKLIKEKEEAKLLVIPLKNSQKTSSALASLRNLKQVLNGDEQIEDGKDASKSNSETTNSNAENVSLSLEQRVIKELLNDGNNIDNENDPNADKLTLPMAADRLAIDGAEQSTIDDYDKIPITQFGLAMLRGMGLKDEEIKSKQNKDPELRPKGMGLGADKLIKKTKLLVAPAANEILEIKKNACVRILGGKYKDLYGQIEGLDDHACRIIVKMALGGRKEAFNEFMVQPVSKKEYQEYGKVINSVKYDEYKRKQEEKDMKKEIKTEVKKESQSESSKIKMERAASRERIYSKAEQNLDSSPRYSKNDEHGNSSQQQSRDRSGERTERNRRDNSRDRRDRRDHRDRSRERSRRSSSYDRNRTKELERSSHKSRLENRRSRSMDKINNQSSKSRNDSTKDDKYSRRNERARSASNSSTFDSTDSDSDDSRHKKRSHHKKSKKKSHKKKSSKKYDSSDDDRHIKKKTKKSKRERSRSTGRR